MERSVCIFLLGSLLAPAVTAFAAEPAPKPAPSTTPADTGDLYDLGKQLFDQYATPEVKAQFAFPSRESWDNFAQRLQQSLENTSLADLAAQAPEARAALMGLQALPGYEDYAEWLEERLDYMEAAEEIAPSRPGPTPTPVPSIGPRSSVNVPYYNLWLSRVSQRPVPARAASLMPQLRTAFSAEGVPAELAWLAEAESSFNPAARSPVGAKGLFQFMPETAKALGLSTFLPDERSDPQKSARAAARYLKSLHGRFGSWPLAIAAYNAGEGRVSRAMKARSATDFAGVASALPTETRMYVPKVCALIATRSGVTPDKIPAPR